VIKPLDHKILLSSLYNIVFPAAMLHDSGCAVRKIYISMTGLSTKNALSGLQWARDSHEPIRYNYCALPAEHAGNQRLGAAPEGPG
jgi:hypothetical protein